MYLQATTSLVKYIIRYILPRVCREFVRVCIRILPYMVILEYA